jgi:ATP-dependent Clp protease protease subunit
MVLRVPWPDDKHGTGRPPPPDDPFADGVRAHLFRRRTVLVSGFLDDESASHAAAELMTLDATGDDAIQVQLDAAGGTLDAAFAVMDTIDLCGVEVHVTCVGRAEGTAVGVLAAGHRRAATEHARIRLVDPELSVEGRASELADRTASLLARLADFHERLAATTRRTSEQVADDCRQGRYLSAHEAVSYGLIDRIAGRGASLRSLPQRDIGFRPPRRP